MTYASITSEKREPDVTIPAQIENMQNRRAVRWYVLVLPSCHKGSARGLQAELDRRNKYGETPFEFFAPTYVEMKEVRGVLIKTGRPLLYNYIFIHASEIEIYRIKQVLPLYNFLPRIRERNREYYPYLSDETMTNLQWVAQSYSNVVPVYAPEPDRLMKGDKVRIIEGQFKNAEATVISQPGAGRKDIMVCVENWMWVPLLHVQPGQYEVIKLNTDSKHLYTRLDNDQLQTRLHEALQRHYSPEGVTEKDRMLVSDTLKQYANLQMDTDVMRSKLYALLLQAYTICGDKPAVEKLIGTIQALSPLIKAEQSRALLLVTLYGCTDNSLYYDQAHKAVTPWRQEENPKRIKQQLLQRLDDYDLWLGHRQ